MRSGRKAFVESRHNGWSEIIDFTMDELIKIDEFKTQQLPYYVKFTADIVVAKPSLYKEDIHSTLYKVIEMFNPQYLQQQYVLKAFQNVLKQIMTK